MDIIKTEEENLSTEDDGADQSESFCEKDEW